MNTNRICWKSLILISLCPDLLDARQSRRSSKTDNIYWWVELPLFIISSRLVHHRIMCDINDTMYTIRQCLYYITFSQAAQKREARVNHGNSARPYTYSVFDSRSQREKTIIQILFFNLIFGRCHHMLVQRVVAASVGACKRCKTLRVVLFLYPPVLHSRTTMTILFYLFLFVRFLASNETDLGIQGMQDHRSKCPPIYRFHK